MKITGKFLIRPSVPATASPRAPNPPSHSDLPPQAKTPRRTPRRKARLRKAGDPAGRRSSRPETPLLKWKTEDRERNDPPAGGGGGDGDGEDSKSLPQARRRSQRTDAPVSSRKLAAVLWRLQLTGAEGHGGDTGGSVRDEVRVQSGAGHFGSPFVFNRTGKVYNSDAKDLDSPYSVSGTRNGFSHKLEPSFQLSSSAMEGVTKWDPVSFRVPDDVRQIHSHVKLLNQQVSAVSAISLLEAELEQARARIIELETERRSSKKKLEHFLKKVSEEKAAWRRREHEKIRAFVDDIKLDLNRERKNRQRMEVVNSKLVDELAEAKLSVKRLMQDYEKERKTRELIEEVCDELAKEIGEDKAEMEAMKEEYMKLREEVEEERKMLQMAEVWREERVQMKLVDAKVALEQKYSQMNSLVADLENFLKSRNHTPDVKDIREAELLRQAAASMNIRDMKEFSYEPPNPDDLFAILEEVNNFGENNEREIEQCTAYSPASRASKIRTMSPEVNMLKKDNINRYPTAFPGHNGDIEEDESGWETVSNLEDQGSSYSPDGSAPSVNNIQQNGNILASGSETPVTEISEVCSVPTRQQKKVSSIARLWRSCPNNGKNYKIVSVEGTNGMLSNGRISNGAVMSPDHGSGKGGCSPSDMVSQWSSPDTGNPHITRGMKGCIEWPRGAQKISLKAKLLEARVESQKIQLRHVLKQKM
ncbi:kinectin isoform X1 [Rhodamnia argentea]|uniref:Kinectin isoform X1 n=1 Tax=Rhodamnia argentea TaxID=178133 RepID=A0A8B8Q9J4_9MYRT|nr:kinectin isoform X1 [Rhodamnia argentea]